MKKIVLGTARLSRSSKTDAEKLLTEAILNGIKRFDTAPSYGSSQEWLSEWIHSNRLGKEVLVNTKLGQKELSDVKTLLATLDKIKDMFKHETVEVIFIHSLDIRTIGVKVFDKLALLRQQGEIAQLGYSGDNTDLENALKAGIFDAVMCSVSPIDNRNLEILRDSKFAGSVFAKRVMANFAWSTKNVIRQKLPRKNNWVVAEYAQRIEKYLPELSKKSLAQEFTRYAICNPEIDSALFGLSTVQHLRNLVKRIKFIEEQMDSKPFRYYKTVSEPAIT